MGPGTGIGILGAALFGSLLILLLFRVLAHVRHTTAARARLDLQTRLIDKIGSAEELRAYLESGAAEQLSNALAPKPREAYNRIIVSAAVGAGLTIGGGTLQGFAAMFGEKWIWVLAGFISVAGVSCLVASYVAYRLSKSWGLLERRG
jgi:hypothetical protein